MAQAHLLVQRVAGTHNLEIARVESVRHFEDLDLHWITLRSEGVAIAKNHRHIPRALAGGSHRVAIDRRVWVGDFRKGGPAYCDGATDLVGAQLGGVFNESFHRRR